MALPAIDNLIPRTDRQGPGNGSHARHQRRDGQPADVQSLGGAPDRVELSTDAPQPLPADLVERAGDVAWHLAEQEPLTAGQSHSLRQDRIFAALAHLLALGLDKGDPTLHWPTGLPAPSSAELKEAYRRLSQRLLRLDRVRDARHVAQLREHVLDALRKTDIARPAGALPDPAPVPLAATA